MPYLTSLRFYDGWEKKTHTLGHLGEQPSGFLNVQPITMQQCLAVHFDWLQIQKAVDPVLPKNLDDLGFRLKRQCIF